MEVLEVIDQGLKTRQGLSQLTDGAPCLVTDPGEFGRDGEGRLTPGATDHEETQIVILDLLFRE